MKAIVYTKYGSPDVLTAQEVEKPRPNDHEVLVKIHAVSVNSWDWDRLRGKPLLTRLEGGPFKPKYKILGVDIAGQVIAVGKDVKELRLGDDVFGDISGCGWGGFAEYVCVPEHALSYKSPSMTFEEAAAIPQAAVLALQGLRNKGKLRAGQKVLINGAGGGVGTFALQLAKMHGAEVTGVDSACKLDLLKSMGADEVIDYMQEDFLQRGLKYDLILDVVGSRSIFDFKRVLHPKGAYVMVGGPPSRIFQLLFLGPLISITGKKMSILIHKPNKQDQNMMKELFEADHVIPIIDRCYPLNKTAEALRYVGEGHARGKVVIRVVFPPK
ncbi:NAD(P)-dependent alcohol dehydrogenase [Sporosarcina sp. ACRSL]|uniref:NAD(P)-dependent alcohol dehydrogenase n=1 Tax=Sporosarcina sp. ACRSL TaxID=2918215 RepID=UPI001EF4050E|nr:NAD(P)-dependent alcohol dehydrogenase [Sporosarcina sp. ACRSL]MCG7345850.1 NAD(P)-dependent alcohol dehydrogenase [Sporosarcina sp. ACRSL]